MNTVSDESPNLVARSVGAVETPSDQNQRRDRDQCCHWPSPHESDMNALLATTHPQLVGGKLSPRDGVEHVARAWAEGGYIVKSAVGDSARGERTALSFQRGWRTKNSILSTPGGVSGSYLHFSTGSGPIVEEMGVQTDRPVHSVLWAKNTRKFTSIQ